MVLSKTAGPRAAERAGRAKGSSDRVDRPALLSYVSGSEATIDWVVLASTVATAAAALFTGWQAREVRRTVGAQGEDRRLLYQPYIDVYETSDAQAPWRVENIGRGIALKCVVFRWRPDPDGGRGASRLMALGAGQWKPLLTYQLDLPSDHIFEPFTPTSDRVDIAICEDELGTLHRFGPSGFHETYSRDERSKPAWTAYADLI